VQTDAHIGVAIKLWMLLCADVLLQSSCYCCCPEEVTLMLMLS
jgi:hypothetical protein